jgi:hypothetical protein
VRHIGNPFPRTEPATEQATPSLATCQSSRFGWASPVPPAYRSKILHGVAITGADFDNDGTAEIVTVAAINGHLKVFDL